MYSKTVLLAANRNRNTVTVIDARSNRIERLIPVGPGPTGIAVGPNEHAYVNNFAGSTVSVVRYTTGEYVATVPVGIDPVGIAASPNRRYVYVSSTGDDSITQISTSTNEVLSQTPAGGDDPTAIAFSPVGDLSYVCLSGGGAVAVIDLADPNQGGNGLPVGSTPNDVVFNEAGTRAYVTNRDSQTVSVIDTSVNFVMNDIPIPGAVSPTKNVLSPDGSTLYVCDSGTNSVYMISTVTETVVGAITIPDPVSVAVSRMRDRLYVGSGAGGSITVIDTKVHAVVDTITGIDEPYALAVTDIEPFPLSTGILDRQAGDEFYVNINYLNTSSTDLAEVIVLAFDYTSGSKVPFIHEQFSISPNQLMTKKYWVSFTRKFEFQFGITCTLAADVLISIWPTDAAGNVIPELRLLPTQLSVISSLTPNVP
ncbi:YncE family protein [Paenibacillus kobensis]|uniref:YncE family protein n=1 Tax=Paenibacillus kobensis TaxID=59841 RepID=UPI0013E325A1|nr:YncE family protein [Paenibacillus kobensis]